jgi:excinuclease ABC subunit C
MRVERDARSSEIRRSEERVFLPGRVNPVILARNSNALFLLQRVRDEAHRFAITYHQKLRDASRLRSPLDDIPGVGRARRLALLRHFGSLTRVRAATAEELMSVPGIGREMAERLARELGNATPPLDAGNATPPLDAGGATPPQETSGAKDPDDCSPDP